MGLFDALKKLFHNATNNTPTIIQIPHQGNETAAVHTLSLEFHIDRQPPDIIPLNVLLKKAVPTKRGLYPHEILMLDYAHTYSTDLKHQHFQGFWYYDYSVKHPAKVLKSLEERGFIKPGDLQSAIQRLTVTVIKNELKAIGQKVTGKKADLIDRLLKNASLQDLGLRLAINDALAKGPADFADFLRLMAESGYAVKHGRGGVISFLVPGQERATRLRASTLGEGYDPENIRAVIAGKRPVPHIHDAAAPTPRRVNLIVDIQERLRSGKGPAYERWAKVYNLKQMAAALMFLQEHQLTEYDQLAAQADGTAQRFHALAGELRQTEADLAKTSALMEAVVQYAKSRPVFEGYKAARYSKKYLAEHGPELADYRAAKAALNELLDGEKLPKMDALKEKRRKLAARKKALYAEYRAAQQEMREAVAVKANIDHLLGLSDERKNKEQER